MEDTINNLFKDPVFVKVFLTISAFVFIGAFAAFFSRLLTVLSVADERKSQYKRWIITTGIIVFIITFLRVWVYPFLMSLFSPNISGKILSSVILFLIVSIAAFFAGRLLIPGGEEPEKKNQYQKLINAAFFALYLIFMVQVWSDVQIFKNSIIRRIISSAVSFTIVYIALIFVRRFINSLKIDIARRHIYRKRATYATTLIYLISLIPIWAGSTKQWATVFSVTGAGVALALRDVLLNLAGWIYIVFRRPYREGDRIEMDTISGDVIDIQLFQTTLLEIGNWAGGDQSTGRMVQFPNGKIFQTPIFNYTKGFEYIWDEISVLVTFESNWRKAEEVLLKAGDEVSRDIQHQVKSKIRRLESKYLIYYTTFTPIVYISIEESGVKLTLRFLTETKKRRSWEDIISRKIMEDINSMPDVALAYPTVRVYKRDGDNPSEKR